MTLEPTPNDPASLRPRPPKRPSRLAPIGAAVLAGLAKFKGLLVFLKTGGTMLLSMWLYARFFGWPYAVGFVLLLFVHECGHLIAARVMGLRVSAPAFIPFMGAMITLKERPHDAWVEAWVGIGGPLLGTLGAVLCYVVYATTGDPLFRALAYSAFWLNLFNLIPILPLDGGRIASAISPWLWVIGVVVLCGILYQHFNFFVLILVLLSLPRVWATLTRREIQTSEYFRLSTSQRLTMGTLYFSLAALLALGMQITQMQASSPPPDQAASVG